MAHRLSAYAETLPGLEQYAVTAFSEALEAIPVALAENAGLKGQDVVSRLYAAHAKGDIQVGVDNMEEGTGIKNAHTAGIWDLFQTKFWGLKFAANAANTVLRVDQVGLCGAIIFIEKYVHCQFYVSFLQNSKQ